MWEAVFIVVVLGLLEYLLWRSDRQELEEQTKLLRDIADTLAVKEYLDTDGQKTEQQLLILDQENEARLQRDLFRKGLNE